ncbi:hypothetical protein HMPREF1544_02808 [Mucor circinelloides 1006PhL]|uniref:F-box domain-containing protein n=1 Tax=Mucor circinelloides f. circinelloides (strain 1006PhL) TaxID=1220926 RepID=S2K4K7_MUCC1|nr:hypothetical protein HMPREF1544_02808 [Mucor circinelloides 1006PhL]
MSSAWNKLPFEVLTYIFEHNADLGSQNTGSRRELYSYQLVCKGWSKAAQSLLYKRIVFEGEDEGDELRRLVQFVFTLKTLAPHLGSFVRTIFICDYLELLQTPLTALDVIFNACPKIEQFYCKGSSKEIAWPYLLTLPDAKLSSIHSISQDDGLEYPNMYPFVAFKLRKSLSELQHLEIAKTPSWNSTYLLDNISQFVSLQELMLSKCDFDSYNTICQVIDKCSPTLSKLLIINYTPSTDMDAAVSDQAKETIKFNYSVQEVIIKNSFMSSASYFAVKFRNLKRLTLDQVLPFQTPDQWIDGLTDLCTSLSEYSLCFNLTLEGSIKDNCIDLTKRSANKNTYLVIDYNALDVEDRYVVDNVPFGSAWGIVLKKEGTHSGIEVRLDGTDHVDDEFDCHTHWFDDYSPKRITIKNVQEIKWRLVMGHDTLLEATTQLGFAFSFRDFIRNASTDLKNWTILSRTISSTAGTTDAAVVSFSEMIIANVDQIPVHSTQVDPNIKQLAFTNTIFYYQALPILSTWLPRLDTLILDTCYTLMEEPYTLTINLQETRLRRLGIVVAPLTFADSLPRSEAVGRHQLKNTDLLKALAPGNKLTLKIDTENKTFLGEREGNTTLRNYNGATDICHGTETNFLIWIQCKTLEEIAIVDGTLNTDVERYFEPLVSL